MAGIFGIASKDNCSSDLFWGIHYLQHRAQDYCGMAFFNGNRFYNQTHKGLVRQQFKEDTSEKLKGNFGIGVVSSERQPVSELSKYQGFILAFDGNIVNRFDLKNYLLKESAGFSGYHDPEDITDSVIISKIIAGEASFELGIKKLLNLLRGDFAIVALTKYGVYAARGFGRKPLILGQKNGSYAVSSESVSFVNLGFEIIRDVEPGEVVLLNDIVHNIAKFDALPVKYGTFEWVYNAYPVSVIDGRNVAEVRMKIGELLAKRYPVSADIVSSIPNSGRWHALGFSKASGLPYVECFVRYDYSDRSYTPSKQVDRDKEAKTKLIPIKKIIEGKRIVIVDDSIVRGTQMLNKVLELKKNGAKEVHARIACPALMAACKYGKTTKKDSDCIARRMSIENIKEQLKLDSLGYATVEDLEQAIGFPREKLCLECWGM